jgi:hypothetical protein
MRLTEKLVRSQDRPARGQAIVDLHRKLIRDLH